MQITRKIIVDRGLSFGRDHYLFFFGVMKSVAFFNAAYVLAKLISDLSQHWIRLPFWFAGFAALIVTYSTMFRGIPFIGSHINVWDILGPVLLTVVEFLLFSVLEPTVPATRVGVVWYLVFVSYCASACLIIWNRRRELQLTDYDSEVRELALQYHSWLSRDLRHAKWSVVGWLAWWAFLVFVLNPRFELVRLYHPLVGLVAFGIMLVVIVSTERDRKAITEFMS